jgi:hypothetical protein
MQEPVQNSRSVRVDGEGEASKAPERSTKVIAQELAQLRTTLDNFIDTLPDAGNIPEGQVAAPNTRQAIKKKLNEALKKQGEISQGNLIEQLQTQKENMQQTNLLKELVNEANIQDKNKKDQFNNALSNYLNKRRELAQSKIQECTQEDKYTRKAQKFIVENFVTPEGKQGGKEISKLGSDISHIEHKSGKKKEMVKCNGNTFSSSSPRHLALAVKSKNINSFKFTDAKPTSAGARNLINSIEEMLKVGVKNVTIDEKLLSRMLQSRPPYVAHNSEGYAMALGRYIYPSAILKAIINLDPSELLNFIRSPTVNDWQKSKLRQLNRICKASTAAYKLVPNNPVFDENGDLKEGNDSTTLGHQAETFMRLTSEKDRVAYLNILYPDDKERHCAELTKELENRNKTFGVGNNKVLSPKEYFEQKMLWPWKKSGYQSQMDLRKDLNDFQLAKTDEKRKELYCKTTDEKILRKMVKTKAMDDNSKRKDFVHTVFDETNKIQADGKHAIKLQPPSFMKSNHLKDEDKNLFTKRAMTLISAITFTVKTKDGDNEIEKVDHTKTLKEKLALLAELRDKALSTYNNEKANNNPIAFDNYLKNKILLDELEGKILEDQQQKMFHDPHYQEAVIKKFEAEFQANNPGKKPDDNAKVEALRTEIRKDTLPRFFDTYNEIPDVNAAQRANHFLKQFGLGLQQAAWKDMDTETRAQVLKKFMDLHNETASPAALRYLKDSVKSLMAMLDHSEKPALIQRVADLCHTSAAEPIHGDNHAQNKALHALRDLVPTPAAKPLSSKALFKRFFEKNQPQHTPDELAAKLLNRIQCFAVRTPGHFMARRALQQKFDAQMRELLFPNNAAIPRLQPVLKALKEKAEQQNQPGRKSDVALGEYIKRIESMQPIPNQKAGSIPNNGRLDEEMVDIASNGNQGQGQNSNNEDQGGSRKFDL